MKLQNQQIKKINGIISTDDILPAKYKHSSLDPAYYAKHIFENKYPNIANSIEPNTVIVNDQIFGVGSSREQAVSALLSAGVTAIIAPQFGRIFYRNAWNLTLPCFELPTDNFEEQSSIGIDFDNKTITTSFSTYSFPKIPKIMLDICLAGGLLAYYKAVHKYEK